MKHLLLFLSFVCLPILTLAQKRIIRGKVTDDTGAPLQGVSVIPKGSKNRTGFIFDVQRALSCSFAF